VIVKSIRQLAAQLGVTHTLLNGYKAEKRFAAEPGGGYDVEKVRAALAQRADISQPRGGRQSAPEATEFGGPGSAGSTYDIFNRARAAKELAIAKERQLNLKKREGQLLELDDVERTWQAAARRVVDRLLNVPDKLAPRVAALSDVLEIRALIDGEIRAVIRAMHEAESDVA
jgi:phage terminase Nu1 subunit (DNA packaging protein)